MERALKDPGSARYPDWSVSTKSWSYSLAKGRNVFGYRVCVKVNAKNSMGGYTGRKLFYFLINDGYVVNSRGGNTYGTYGEEIIEKLCGLL